MSKLDLRLRYIDKRKSLSSNKLSKKVFRNFEKHFAQIIKNKNIGIYHPIKGEVSLGRLKFCNTFLPYILNFPNFLEGSNHSKYNPMGISNPFQRYNSGIQIKREVFLSRLRFCNTFLSYILDLTNKNKFKASLTLKNIGLFNKPYTITICATLTAINSFVYHNLFLFAKSTFHESIRFITLAVRLFVLRREDGAARGEPRDKNRSVRRGKVIKRTLPDPLKTTNVLKHKERMEFKRLVKNAVVRGRFSIASPKYASITQARIPDVIIVPLVCFSESCGRIGYGGGFYDRYFSRINKYANNNRCLKIGLAFNFQKTKLLPQNSFDIRLDYIVTETRIFSKH